MKHQGIREIIRITEYRQGCVYKTKSEGFAWVTFDHVSKDKDIQFASVGLAQQMRLKVSGMRTVIDSIPDVVKLCSCTKGNSESERACMTHGISAQLNRTQME